MRARKSTSKRINPERGIHVARLVQILDYGTQVDSYSPDGRAKVEFVWELPEDLHVFNEDKGEQPLLVDRKYGNTLGRGSAMLKAIEEMLGRKWDKDEELDTLLGTLCQMNIDLVTDGEYENVEIKSLMPLSSSQTIDPKTKKPFTAAQMEAKYPTFTEQFVLDLENFNQEHFDMLPQYKKDNIAKSEEYANAIADLPATKPVTPSKQPPAPPARQAAYTPPKTNVFAGKGSKPPVKKR